MSDTPAHPTVDYAANSDDRRRSLLLLGIISLCFVPLQALWFVVIGMAVWSGWLGEPNVRSNGNLMLCLAFAPSILAIVTGILAAVWPSKFKLHRVFGILGALGGSGWFVWLAMTQGI